MKDQGTSDCIGIDTCGGIHDGSDSKGGIGFQEQTGRFSKGSTDC